MSKWIVLMVPATLDAEGLLGTFPESLAQATEVSAENGELIVREKGQEIVAQIAELAPRDEGVADYGGNGLHRPVFRAQVPNLRFFVVCYFDAAAFRVFLEQLLSGWRGDLDALWVEDDCGEIRSGPELLHRLRTTPEWDWRLKKSWTLSLISHKSILFEELVELFRSNSWRVEVNKEQRELLWLDARDPALGWSVVLFAVDTEQESPDDPILIKILSETFGQSIYGLSCFLLHFNDLDLVKNVLRSVLEGLGDRAKDIWIDFDDGTVMSGEETLEWLDLETDWDWRPS